ncbi:MAG: carboxypeptidase-like regulatory domain-containing protein, partial [Paludibacteraceae bacterium]|nr:carboxypeptidase-like regulatory domain-containing protein [Paludibacteraceae bacterium]
MRKFLALIVLVLGSVATYAAQTITGTVLNAADGEPIIGASIVVEGSTTGTITDTDGKFSLSVESGDKVTVSFIGMAPQTLLATDGMVVRLSEDAKALEEVLVVAYGTAKKSSFTGSAESVHAEDMELRPITSVTKALEGNVSGVQMSSSSGQPGSAPSIRIRGFGSINASNAPLYVVDGIPYDGDLASLNPSDI